MSELLIEEEPISLLTIKYSSNVLVKEDSSNPISFNSTVKKASLQGDYFILLGRSIRDNKIKGGRQYINSGNSSAARAEFNKIGGKNYEYRTELQDGQIKYLKEGSDGTAVLYRSKSTYDNIQRPTISFNGYKVRFIGD